MTDISVVVIVFNDEGRLARAIESVLSQDVDLEVLLVDDASTDGTPRVVKELAADRRIRAVRLPQNSGPAVARNTGLSMAAGEWVGFVDSDDELEPGALAAMLDATRSRPVDVVSGLVRRVYDDGTITKWKPDLHTKQRLVSAASLPRLLHDTICAGKLYRRSLLTDNAIEFPVGVYFEDYRFSAMAYASTDRVLLLPDCVYRWNVLIDAENASITRRLHQVESFADRLEAHRLAVSWLRSHGHQAHADELEYKFVTHDLRLGARHLHARDTAYVTRFRELAVEFLGTLPQSVQARVSPTDVLMMRGLRTGDFALVDLAARVHYRGKGREESWNEGKHPAPPWWRRVPIWAGAIGAAGVRALRR